MNHPKSGLAQDRLFGDLKEQSLMATLLAHSPAAIAMTDVNMNYLLLSQRWCEDYGLREQDCLSQSHYEAFPFLSQQWQNHYEACLQGEIRQGRQDEIIRPDGRKEWIKWEIRPWFENDDKVGGLIIFTELITGLVEAQARNEAMNQLLKSVISHTREQISIIDLQGNLLLGASPEQETSSSNIFDSLSIGQQQLLKEGMQRVQQSKQAHIYQSASHIGEGTTHWFDNCLSPLEDSLGEVTHFVLLRHDITRLVDATEKIRASEHQLRMIYEATSDYIYVLSPEGKIEFVNRSFPPASPNDLLGTYLWDTIPQLEREGVIQKFDSALALQRTVEYESELQLDNGMTIYLRNQLFPVKDALGKVERLILFAQDVSPIKAANLTLEKINEELEERVRKRTEALSQANEEIRQFSSVMSHDLRVPLVNVRGFAEELELSLDKLRTVTLAQMEQFPPSGQKELMFLLHEDLPESVDFIRRAGFRMQELIDSILNLAKLGSQPVQWQKLNLNHLVEECLVHFQHQIKQRNAEVILQSLPDLVGDKSMVRQIISNLIDNALKYQHPDRRLELKVSGYKNEEAVVLEFQDNGKGISEKDFDSIFHLFQRSDPSNTPGEGIGLSLVQRMLERLNGQIELESQLEQGSLFRIRFRS